MDFESATKKLKKIHQDALLDHWEKISPKQKSALLIQINDLNSDTFKLQRKQILSPAFQHEDKLDRFSGFLDSQNTETVPLGKKLIHDGRVGCVVMAGGQGTRLRFDGPKGMFPVSNIKNKSLFQLLAEKILAAGKQVELSLPLAVMTSPYNDEQTQLFFRENDYFGLKESQVYFFSQGMLPFLNQKGDLFLDESFKMAEGPDGNGSSLKCFVDSGIWDKWASKGIKDINFVLVDNPLADPYDAALVGYHNSKHSDVTIKCIPRSNAQESVGVIVKKNGKVQVVEYFELPSEERVAVNPDGSLKHYCANLSLFCISMAFVKKMAELTNDKMPLHVSLKSANPLNQDDFQIHNGQPMAWKFERFIFDMLPMASKVEALLYQREECFAPLKNYSGQDSIETVKKALQDQDVRVITKISGKKPEKKQFELAPEFYYPTPELLTKWKGKKLPKEPYIVA